MTDMSNGQQNRMVNSEEHLCMYDHLIFLNGLKAIQWLEKKKKSVINSVGTTGYPWRKRKRQTMSYIIHKSSLEMPHNYSGKNIKLPAGKIFENFC